MKIGILTLPFNNNYGGYLQAFALMSCLKEMGHSVELIYRKHNRRPLSWRCLYFIKQIIKRILRLKCYHVIPDQEKDLRIKGELIVPFLDKYIQPRTSPLYSSKEFVKVTENYDIIIVGSDQVWRPDYVPNINDFFLAECKNEHLRKVSYAASFGTNYPVFTKKEIELCGEALKYFYSISVREKGALDIFKRFHWNFSPHIVLDPTMLISREIYDAIIGEVSKVDSSFFLCYVLDASQELETIVRSIAQKSNMNVKQIIDPYKWKEYDYVMPSVQKWLQSIRDADFVITDSFHGTVFSILFNTPFVVWPNAKRGSERFISLLEQFGLSYRIQTTKEGIEKCFMTKIDWGSVNKTMTEKKSESVQFLEQCLI